MLKYHRILIIIGLLGLAFAAQGQSTITGKVIDSRNRLPLVKVQVTLKGTNQSILTDEKGKFTISYHNENQVLVISFIGYLSQEIPIKTSTPLKVVLKHDKSFIKYPLPPSSFNPPEPFLQLSYMQSVNHTPFGLELKSLIPAYLVVHRLFTKLQYQWGQGNSASLFRLGRYEAFSLWGASIDSEIEMTQFDIQSSFRQKIRSWAWINSVNYKQYWFGLGLGLVNDQSEAQTQRSVAFVGELSRQLLFGINGSLQIKAWKDNTLVNWRLGRYLARPKLGLQLYGRYLGSYKEFGAGIGYLIE